MVPVAAMWLVVWIYDDMVVKHSPEQSRSTCRVAYGDPAVPNDDLDDRARAVTRRVELSSLAAQKP